MKKIIFSLAILLLSFDTQAYDFSGRMPQHRHISAVTIVGIPTMCVGLGVTVYGFLNAIPQKYGTSNNDYKGIVGAGIALVVIGAGLTIGGGIYDHSKPHNKWSIITLKKNEIGLAYNF